MAGILLSYNNAMFQGTGEILFLTSAEGGMQLRYQVRINVNHLWLIINQTHGKKDPSGKL